MPQFRAKARAVDLLGKGQIADLPTAISELWKNGYDAYGDKLQASLYFRGYQKITNNLLVISDNGTGMTREDILEKWIVLGTDSKSRNKTENKPSVETLWKEPRVKMGEKGIGRLSVAYLGPQMLMLTKKIGSPVQALYFDWRILENWNLFLDDINIPVRHIETARSASNVFESLKEDFLKNFSNKNKEWSEQTELKNQIIDSTELLTLPDFFDEEILSPLMGSSKEIHGTTFVIFSPDEQFEHLKPSLSAKSNQEEVDQESIDYIRAGLLGLYNVFTKTKSDFVTNFWIVDQNGRFDFIDKNEFFVHEDFETADHLIQGTFNKNGQFKGTIRIFEKEIEHSFRPHRSPGESGYGPFKIKLGYLQGDIETKRLRGDERRGFMQKLKTFGGLYIYRDGFRVLPYGRTEYDFLKFEKRRSYGAGYHFFSHRRMFGYMEITRDENSTLRDKAGREGFINNQAYRDFVKDLEDFFIDLARTYYGDKAKYDYKQQQQDRLSELAASEKAEREKEKEERRNLASQIRAFPAGITALEKEFETLTKKLAKKLEEVNVTYAEIKALLDQIEEAKVKVDNLKIPKPTRYKPTELQRKHFFECNKTLQHFKATTVENANTLLEQAGETLKDIELFNEFQDRANQYKGTLASFFDEERDKFARVLRKLSADLDNEKDRVISDFGQRIVDITPTKDRKEIKQSKKILENLFRDTKEKVSNRILPFIAHLQKINFDVNEDELVGYYKIKYEEIEDEWEKTRELAQLGIAVEVIDHQFNVLYSQLSTSIDSFEPYTRNDKNAKKEYGMLTNAFEHLENNYKLLTPLYRTSGRVRKEISGLELYDYLGSFFSEQFKDKRIKFEITSSAKRYTLFSYESIVKPVLINVINNAIYWLQSSPSREIKIDSSGDKLLVMNSGDSIDDHILDDVFKLFFSKRPKGRGIGLYLAKKSLNGIGYEIEATNEGRYNKLDGACFMIYPISKK